MGSTFHSLHYHIVFSTKERRPLIHATWRQSLHEYMGGTVRGLGGIAEAVGGVEDHVHLLVNEARAALTLREVCGLTTEEIARAFLTAPPTVAQRIVRAKAKIAGCGEELTKTVLQTIFAGGD